MRYNLLACHAALKACKTIPASLRPALVASYTVPAQPLLIRQFSQCSSLQSTKCFRGFLFVVVGDIVDVSTRFFSAVL